MKPRALVFLMVATCFVLIAAVAVEGWHLRVRSLPALGKHANLNYRTKPDYALLPESEVSNYAKLFSPSPDSDMQSWEPTVSEIGALEANLVQVSSLRENVPAASRHIDNPEGYFRQYVAVIQHGKKLIFVNALCQIPESVRFAHCLRPFARQIYSSSWAARCSAGTFRMVIANRFGTSMTPVCLRVVSMRQTVSMVRPR